MRVFHHMRQLSRARRNVYSNGPLIRLVFEQDRASSQEPLLGAVPTEQEAVDFIAKREAEGTDNAVTWIEMPLLDADALPVDGSWVYVIVGGTGNVQDEEGNIGPSPRAVFADEMAAQALYDRQIKENSWSPPHLLKLRLGEIRRIEEFGLFRGGLCRADQGADPSWSSPELPVRTFPPLFFAPHELVVVAHVGPVSVPLRVIKDLKSSLTCCMLSRRFCRPPLHRRLHFWDSTTPRLKHERPFASQRRPGPVKLSGAPHGNAVDS